MKKILVSVLILSSFFISCSKTKKEETIVEEKIEENNSTENQNKEIEEDKKSISIQDYLNNIKIMEKGGFTVYGDVEFCELPKNCKLKEYSVFGLDGDEGFLETAPKEIKLEISSFDNDVVYTAYVSENVFQKESKIYLEAVHDGKSFLCNDKNPVELIQRTAMDGSVYYLFYFSFVNRNLYSANTEWILNFRSCQNDEIIAKKMINQVHVSCNYVVYKDEYENPFVSLNHNSIKPYEKNHLLYKGDVLILSYGRYYGKGISYIPFAAVKTKQNKNGVCDIEFSLKQDGQYKVDFYDSRTGIFTETSCFDYITVEYQKGSDTFLEKEDTEWKVNSLEGLRYRNAPWGEKIGVFEDATQLIQTEEIYIPFFDCIDNVKGFWIPVRLKYRNQEENQESPFVYCDNPDMTMGWVFSGFLTKIK